MNTSHLEKEVQNITQQLIAKYKPQKIILFGSAARGEFGPDSDLDFFIIKEKTPYRGVERIREVDQIIKTALPCDFLVVKPHEVENRLQLGDPFIKTILQEGKVLYGW